MKARKDREMKKDRSRRLNILLKETLQGILGNFLFKWLHTLITPVLSTPFYMQETFKKIIMGHPRFSFYLSR